MKLKINNVYIDFFTQITLGLALDTVASTFSVSARFNPNDAFHKTIFKPLSFPKVEIFTNNDELLLTGVVMVHNFKSTKTPNLVTMSGFSLPGVLENVNIPISLYPLESIKRTLKEIATRLITPFGIELVVDESVVNEVNMVFEKSVADPSESIKSYLSKLTSQRNIVLSHNQKGNLVMYKASTNTKPVLLFTKENTDEMSFTTDAQKMHSEVSVISQPSISNTNVSLSDTAKNSMISVFRPSVNVLSSGTVTQTKNAADNKLAKELKSIGLTIVKNSLILIKTGSIVEVENDELYLYNPTRFMVSNVSITENKSSQKTTLTLVLPETYTGETPKNIF